jgi:Rieske Fe-S protein
MITLRRLFGLIIIALTISACKRDQVNPNPIPQGPVNISINLALKTPFLAIPGSFFYENGGTRGIAIIHDFDGSIRAFERTCSHEPLETCSTLFIDTATLQFKCGEFANNQFINCCESRFDFSGFAVKAPAQFPLLQYRTSRNGNILNVFN